MQNVRQEAFLRPSRLKKAVPLFFDAMRRDARDHAEFLREEGGMEFFEHSAEHESGLHNMQSCSS